MLKLLDKHRDAKPSAFVRLCSPRFPLPLLSSDSQLSAEQGSNSCPLSCSCSVRCSLWGSAQLLHFISVRRFVSFTPLLHYFFFLYFPTFFWEWLVFAMFLCVFVFVCLYVCVCESRFCVQVRSFNFDLCFRLFCVAFVDFCHLNRNFYFLHVSGYGRGRELVHASWFCIRAAVASF